ncbi:MAG: hypothetical protein Q9M89_00615 [Persephonella sp.]|nr:hypothetical protein [Persephonella sp.]
MIYWYVIGITVKIFVFESDIKLDLIILGLLLLLAFVYIFLKTKSVTTSIIDTLRELLETVTNTVSFVRLGAFALAHSALFLAVFTVAKLIQNEEGGKGVLFWLVVITGNIFIIVLEGIIVAVCRPSDWNTTSSLKGFTREEEPFTDLLNWNKGDYIKRCRRENCWKD